MDLEAHKRKFKKLYRRLYDEVFKLDLYSQPLSLTYKAKTNFSTTYGLVMTLLTFAFVLFVIIDTLYYGNQTQKFVYQNNLNITSIFNVDFSKEGGFYFTLKDSSGVSIDIESFIEADLLVQNVIIGEDPNKYIHSESTSDQVIIKMSKCQTNSYLHPDFAKNPLLEKGALCVENNNGKGHDLRIANVYTSKFFFRFRKREDVKDEKEKILNSSTLLMHSAEIKYEDSATSYHSIKSYEVRINNPQGNSYYFPMRFKRIILYKGYFNIRDEIENYFYDSNSAFRLNNIERFKSYSYVDNNRNTIQANYTAYLEVILPIQVEEFYFQNENFLNAISIIAGYMFIFYSAVKFCVRKCADVKLFESIANETFNMIDPSKKNKISESEKIMKEKLSSKIKKLKKIRS